MSDRDTLYEVDIKAMASPAEVAQFVRKLESEGYHVVTDLSRGKLQIDDGQEADE